MEYNAPMLVADEHPQAKVLPEPKSQEARLFQSALPIIVSTEKPRPVDQRVVAFKFYNSFNYSMVARESTTEKLILGVTSQNRGEGKTLIACNLAASIALGSQRKTVLVDMNSENPKVHEVFGVSSRPGLVDALEDEEIHVSPTRIDNLSVVISGDLKRGRVGLGDLHALQHVLWSLKQQFDFVIVDMSSLGSGTLPINVTNLFSGVLVVLDLKKTRRRDIDKIFRQLHRDNVLGFVFNRVTEDTL